MFLQFTFSQSVPGFRDTSFDKLLWYTNPCTRRQKSGCPGLARAKTSDYTIIERTCQVGDHFLDDLSTYIIRQTYKVISKYLPPDWDPLGFLPLNVQTNLQKNEAIVSKHKLALAFSGLNFIIFAKHNDGCCVRSLKSTQQLNGIEAAGPFLAEKTSSRALYTYPNCIFGGPFCNRRPWYFAKH